MAVNEIFVTKQGCASYPVAELVRGDSNTALIRMMLRKEHGGVDISGLKWAVNVVNMLGVLDSVDVEMVETDSLICGEWLVGGMAAVAVGRTVFQLEGANAEGARVWQSGQYHIDVGDRVDGEAGDGVPEQLMSLQELIAYVNEKWPQVIEAGETAKEAYQHPPMIGENGNWYVWDWDATQYADTGKPSQGSGSASPGEPGEDGGYYVPHVDTDGNLSWTASEAGMPSVEPVNIKGRPGDPGKDGQPGHTPVKGEDYFTEVDKVEMVAAVQDGIKSEEWTFTLEDGSTVNKVVMLK